MDSGVIGVLSEPIREIGSFEYNTKENEGLRSVFKVRQRLTDLSGEVIGFQGQAASEEVAKYTDTKIEDGKIIQNQTSRTEWKHTEFIVIPNGYVVVSSSDGSFVFKMLEHELGIDVDRANIDLHSFAAALDINDGGREVEVWKAGFYNRGGSADNGVIHGPNVMQDKEFVDIISNNPVNQLGIKYTEEGILYKLFLTESGYMSMYQPEEFVTSDFVSYLSQEIGPHLKDSS